MLIYFFIDLFYFVDECKIKISDLFHACVDLA